MEKVSRTSLHISRIPEKTKTRFMQLANEDFEGDFGFTVKYLLDHYDNIMMNPNEILLARIEELEIKVYENSEKQKIRKSLSGRVIGIGGKENVETISTTG